MTFIVSPCKIINVVTQGFTLQAQIAQLVEQRTENPRVTGSIPVLGSCTEEMNSAFYMCYMRV